MGGAADFLKGLAGGLPTGVQLGQRQQSLQQGRRQIDQNDERLDLAKQSFGLEKEKQKTALDLLIAQSADAKGLGEIVGGDVKKVENVSAGNKMAKDLTTFAGLSKAEKQANVDVFKAQWKEQTGGDIPDNVVKTLVNGDPVQLRSMIKLAYDQLKQDPSAGAAEMAEVLNDGNKFTEVVMNLSEPAKQAAVTGSGTTARDGFQAEMVRSRARRSQSIAAAQQKMGTARSQEGRENYAKYIQQLEKDNASDLRSLLQSADKPDAKIKLIDSLVESGNLTEAEGNAEKREVGLSVANATVGTNQILRVQNPATNEFSDATYNSTTNRLMFRGTNTPVPPNFITTGKGTGDAGFEVDENGNITTTGPAGVTLGTQGQLERSVVQLTDLSLRAKEVRASLERNQFGVAGAFIEGAINNVLAQAVPGAFIESVSANRAKMRALREGALRVVSGDTRFSNADREAISKLFPEQGVFESLPEAEQKLDVLIQIFDERNSFLSGQLKRKALSDMSPQDIKGAVKDGSLDRTTAMRALKYMHPALLTKQLSGKRDETKKKDNTEFGLRPDGTPKGKGWLGVIKMDDGNVMSEISIGIEIDGEEILMPSIVPTLSKEEIDFLKAGGNVFENKTIVDKAVEHALKRRKEGKSPFKD